MNQSRAAFSAMLLASLALTAQPAIAQSLSEETLANLEYREIGPTRQSGRFVDIAVPSDDPHTFYIAGKLQTEASRSTYSSTINPTYSQSGLSPSLHLTRISFTSAQVKQTTHAPPTGGTGSINRWMPVNLGQTLGFRCLNT